MANQTKRSAHGPCCRCTCATSLGGLCAVRVQLGNRGWPIHSRDGKRCRGLSPAARSRLIGCPGHPDLFEIELRAAQLESARIRDVGSKRYEVLKGDVLRTAKNPSQYESGIKVVVKRIRY